MSPRRREGDEAGGELLPYPGALGETRPTSQPPGGCDQWSVIGDQWSVISGEEKAAVAAGDGAARVEKPAFGAGGIKVEERAASGNGRGHHLSRPPHQSRAVKGEVTETRH